MSNFDKNSKPTHNASALSACLGAVAVLGMTYALSGIWRANAQNPSAPTQAQSSTIQLQAGAKTKKAAKPIEKVVKTEAQWREILTPQAFHVLREHGTEAAFSGDTKSHGAGIYRCAGCGLNLFDARTKFDSGTGWPSFWQSIPGHALEKIDTSYGMERVEILCARCDGHLGHVFNDGPRPTGLRYCMNAVAIQFVPAAKK